MIKRCSVSKTSELTYGAGPAPTYALRRWFQCNRTCYLSCGGTESIPPCIHFSQPLFNSLEVVQLNLTEVDLTTCFSEILNKQNKETTPSISPVVSTPKLRDTCTWEACTRNPPVQAACAFTYCLQRNRYLFGVEVLIFTPAYPEANRKAHSQLPLPKIIAVFRHILWKHLRIYIHKTSVHFKEYIKCWHFAFTAKIKELIKIKMSWVLNYAFSNDNNIKTQTKLKQQVYLI